MHETPGGNLRQGDYATSGRGIFQRLLNNGLKPVRRPGVDDEHGMLRIGSIIIDYLEPRGYRGLDISQYLL